jgi:hypothetical protein
MRRNDWASRMHGVIAEHRSRRFVWGADDCCFFVARVIDAMTDSTIEAQLYELYGDEGGAKRFIAQHGGMREAVSSILGSESDQRATRGDAVLIEDGNGGYALGICLGSKVVAMGPTGLREVPRVKDMPAWKV